MKGIEEVLSVLQPTFVELEQIRQKRKRYYLPAAVSLAAAILLFFLFPGRSFFAVIVLIVGLSISFGFYTRQTGIYVSQYKSIVIPKVLKSFDSTFLYDPNQGISSEEFRFSELFRSSPDRYSSEDLIWGRHEKTDFKIAEVYAQDRSTDSDGKTSYSTIFRGVIFIADFHKDFSGKTFVFPDAGERMLGSIGRFFQGWAAPGKTDILQMDDPIFEKFFVSYSTDPIEGRYILSASLMERLVSLREHFGNAKLRVAFKNSMVWVAVPYNKGFLEPHSGIAAGSPEQVRQIFSEVESFLRIVDELNLNVRIWSKE